MKFVLSKTLTQTIQNTLDIVFKERHQFMMPEHILISIFTTKAIKKGCDIIGIDSQSILKELNNYISSIEKTKRTKPEDFIVYNSSDTTTLLNYAQQRAEKEQRTTKDGQVIVSLSDVLCTINKLKESWAKNILEALTQQEDLEELGDYIDMQMGIEPDLNINEKLIQNASKKASYDDENNISNDISEDIDYEDDNLKNWKKFVTCISEDIDNHAPIIGRDEEIKKTLQTLCRKGKRNPLHIGEPGVGKTALVYKLAMVLKSDDIPKCLKNCKIYKVDAGSLVSGTKFRGDLEKRIKIIMEGLEKEENAILYLDEIHNILGAGSSNDNPLGVSDLLKPYLDRNKVRIIGSTTYDDFKKRLAHDKALMRRFHEIEIKEPNIDECIEIVKGLKKTYEQYHGVYYTEKALETAVKDSKKYITNKFLPDKAIDLIDEAGAYRVIHRLPQKRQTINEELIKQLICKTCKIDAKTLIEEDNKNISTLLQRVEKNIFGQEMAVKQVVEAVEISKAGLSDINKPMASLLFVGPTGVGKTELARVLSKELGISLIRFDMSEYTEKHSVAKFIGSPAGYVGYEDGGLLTDSIRKHPNCVLLLDEIEKAHQDIYNILLQIMDYGTLTDNRGDKADFKHVILIMTSNAGAQFASQASMGFTGRVSAGDAMTNEVKKIFKPEFINRLTCITVFNEISKEMAVKIMDKKIEELSEKLRERNITMDISDKVKEFLLSRGFSKKYGAREIERTVAKGLNPLLTREILYGKLKKGGNIAFDVKDNQIIISRIGK